LIRLQEKKKSLLSQADESFEKKGIGKEVVQKINTPSLFKMKPVHRSRGSSEVESQVEDGNERGQVHDRGEAFPQSRPL